MGGGIGFSNTKDFGSFEEADTYGSAVGVRIYRISTYHFPLLNRPRVRVTLPQPSASPSSTH